MDKCARHTTTVVNQINEIDGCPDKIRAGDDTLACPRQREKAEYYALLDEVLPDILGITAELRERFPHGLVAYADPDSSDLVSSLNGEVGQKIKAANNEGNFLDASYEVHDGIARTIDISTEEWLRRGAADDPRFARLTDLTDPERKVAYGPIAAQKRISSAMIQTAHISASFDSFIVNMFLESQGRMPTTDEIRLIHGQSAITAAKLTELHLLRTRPVRQVLGSKQKPGGIIQLYTDHSAFAITDNRIELTGDCIVGKMQQMPVDTGDGRIGCPGKRHIPAIWGWIDSVSSEYSYPILEGDTTSAYLV